MLDLQARIGLHEQEALGVDQELDRAHPPVTYRRRDPHRGVQHLAAHFLAQSERRCDFDELLALALQAALAVPQVRHRARPVADDLHLDMPRVLHQFLDVEIARAERLLRLRSGARERLFEIAPRRDRAHAATTAAGDRLEHHRARGPKRVEEGARLVYGHGATLSSGNRHAALHREAPRHCLVPETPERVGVRADEHDARLVAGSGELGRLAQEPVAGVDRLAACLPREFDQAGTVQVRGYAYRPEAHRLVGVPGMQRLRVVLGEHGDRVDAEVGGRADDADGDFAAIGDKESVDHGCSVGTGELVR